MAPAAAQLEVTHATEAPAFERPPRHFSGRLLGTVGRFVAAAAPAPVAAQLAGATAELLAAPQVSAHEEPYVRRAALFAASQVTSPS